MENKIKIIEETLSNYNCNNFDSTVVVINNFIEKVFDYVKSNTDLTDKIIIKSITFYFIRIATKFKNESDIYYAILLNDKLLKNKNSTLLDDIKLFNEKINTKINIINNLETIYYYIDFMLKNYIKYK